MQEITDKISYLQGMSEGLNITEGRPQGRIIAGILNVLNEMAEEITAIQKEAKDIRDYLECVDDDLLDLEEIVVEDEFMELECANCGEQLRVETDFLDDEDVIEIICPNCNEVIFINDGSFDYQHMPVDEEFDLGSSHPEHQ